MSYAVELNGVRYVPAPRRSLQSVQEVNRGLPLDSSGHIRSPKYVGPGDPYLDLWRKWCAATPRAQWPPWLIADIRMMRKPGQPSRLRSPESTAGSEG